MNSIFTSGEINTIILLTLLLIVTNLKPIMLYKEWLYYKISTILKQYLNGRNN